MNETRAGGTGAADGIRLGAVRTHRPATDAQAQNLPGKGKAACVDAASSRVNLAPRNATAVLRHTLPPVVCVLVLSMAASATARWRAATPVCVNTTSACGDTTPVCVNTTSACEDPGPVCVHTTSACEDPGSVCVHTTSACEDADWPVQNPFALGGLLMALRSSGATYRRMTSAK